MELKQATIYTIDRQNNITIKNIPDDSINLMITFMKFLSLWQIIKLLRTINQRQ